MEWLSPVILLVVGVELALIYLRMGNLENKDDKITGVKKRHANKRVRTISDKFLTLFAFSSFHLPRRQVRRTGCFSNKTILFGFCRRPGLRFLSIRFIFIIIFNKSM